MVNNMDHGLPKFSLLGYDDWKIMMEAHLYALHDCMWMVLEDGPLKIQMENPERNPAAPDVVQYIPKPKEKWDDRDCKKHNLDNVAKATIFKTLDPITFSKIKHLKTAMEIWQGLGKLCEGSEDLRKQKIEVLLEKFKSFKMLPGESFDMLDERFHKILNDLASLNHILSPKEKNVRLLRSLPIEWYTKATAMEEGRNLENYTVQGLLDELKTYEHELKKKKEEQVTPFPTALMTTSRIPSSEGICTRNSDTPSPSQPTSSKMENYEEEFAMMVKQFRKFKKFFKKADSIRRPSKGKTQVSDSPPESYLYYNCRKPGHWKSACPYPKVEKYGERERIEKKKKAMVAVESDESSSSSSDEEALVCMERKVEKSNREDRWTMSEDDTLCLMAKDDADQEGGDSMEVIFHDERGTRIHAQLKSSEKRRFESQIIEDGVFGIRNVFVNDNYQTCKTTSHKYLLVFYPKTEVKTLSEKDFPNFKFDLKSFSDLQSQPCLNDQLLIEKLMEITLEDHEGNRLACTLWGEYVEKFLNCLTQGVPGPFILLLSFCKPRRYQGSVTVSTSFHVTKMIFDGNSDEVNQFRASLPLQVDDGSSLNTLIMDCGNEEVNERLKITPLKTLIDTTKPGTYWILGCHMGFTSLKLVSTFLTSPVMLPLRFGTESAKTFWRKMDPNLFPEELNHLIGRKSLFNVVVKSEGGSPHWNGPRSFGVRSFVSDPRILKKYEHVLDIVDDDSKEDVDLWNSLEDLSQKVQTVIGSNNPSSSQGETTSRKKMDAIDGNDPVKRQLLDELSTTSCKKKATNTKESVGNIAINTNQYLQVAASLIMGPVTCTASPLSNITNVIVTTPFDRLPSTPLTHANSSSLNSTIRDTSLLKSCVTQDNVGTKRKNLDGEEDHLDADADVVRDLEMDFIDAEDFTPNHRVNVSRRNLLHNVEYWDVGDCLYSCKNYKAYFWLEERLISQSSKKNPKYSLCCKQGKIKLAPVKQPPMPLKDLLIGTDVESKHFQTNIHSYNCMFSFTSLGGKIIRDYTPGRGPPTFKLGGQNFHQIGSLVPRDGIVPKFAQLYIYDTQNEDFNRIHSVRKEDNVHSLHIEIVAKIREMLDTHNVLVKSFRMMSCDKNNESMSEFGEWMAKISDGTAGDENDGSSEIIIPDDMLLESTDDPIGTIVHSTYPDFHNIASDPTYLQNRAILAPTLDVVDEIIDYMTSLNNVGEAKSYFSSDTVCKSDSNADFLTKYFFALF
ncbi:unnamed protein product [Cuscuta campestris]|uniref:Replication protein A 70 kDa DNA-binding subunit B/D first OB fold domain-containing protein n=1 Tax=Cuscuta campestris TaxID=132261 RepID=A0A484KZR0_9ASTE|nr:unnamed protein product [Cuscuta campestris]